MRQLYLSNDLAKRRCAAGLTQTELAKLCGVSKNCISAIERGVWFPSLKLALSLSFVLMVSVHDIFWLSGFDDEWKYPGVD